MCSHFDVSTRQRIYELLQMVCAHKKCLRLTVILDRLVFTHSKLFQTKNKCDFVIFIFKLFLCSSFKGTNHDYVFQISLFSHLLIFLHIQRPHQWTNFYTKAILQKRHRREPNICSLLDFSHKVIQESVSIKIIKFKIIF